MNCNACKKAKKLTGNKNTKCLKHGMGLLIVHLKISIEPVHKSKRTYHIKVYK